eukprot:2793650-Rhodomonas_salina.2
MDAAPGVPRNGCRLCGVSFAAPLNAIAGHVRCVWLIECRSVSERGSRHATLRHTWRLLGPQYVESSSVARSCSVRASTTMTRRTISRRPRSVHLATATQQAHRSNRDHTK